MNMATRRFACTQCGQCCNRAPEVELGEAAALADVFVLRLLMRIYSLPRSLSDYASDLPRDQASAEFYQTKRLLGAFAAASWNVKVQRGGKVVDYVQYLSLSVLPLDLGGASCPALADNKCSIYERRPLSCRTVPLHYSRPEAAAVRDLDAFVASPGYLCEVSADAPMVIAEGRIVDPATVAARLAASEQAQRDHPWKAALVKAMKAGQHGLPTPRMIEQQAARGALSASMLGAWSVALGAGLIAASDLQLLLRSQSALIERTIQGGAAPDPSATLAEMQREYRAALQV